MLGKFDICVDILGVATQKTLTRISPNGYSEKKLSNRAECSNCQGKEKWQIEKIPKVHAEEGDRQR